MWIILWIISALAWAIWWTYRKKAVDAWKLSTSLFAIFWPVFWIIVILILWYFLWFDKLIYSDYIIISIILLIVIIEIFTNFLEIYVFKKTKLSYLLPYQNLDKLLIVFIWFFIYYWTDNWSSIESFFIILFTIFLIIYFSIDKKNLRIDKIIWIYLFRKTLSAISWLLIGYILLKYSTLSYMSINSILVIITYIIIIKITKDNFMIIFNQTREFYNARFASLFLWWSSFLLSLFLIESLGLLIATLISFLWLVFSIFSMKLILWDTPEKKQIILAFLVSILIWIWYYFK